MIFWERLGERLVEQIFAVEGVGTSPPDKSLFPRRADRRRLAPWLRFPRMGPGEASEPESAADAFAQHFVNVPKHSAYSLRRAGRAWISAALSAGLRTATPDFQWLQPSQAAWTNGEFRFRVARRIHAHLRATTLLHPWPAEAKFPLPVPETFWALLLLAAHRPAPARGRGAAWVHSLRALGRGLVGDPALPMDRLGHVAERALAGSSGWAGEWEQLLLTGATLRWYPDATPLPSVCHGFLGMPRIAAETRRPPEALSAWSRSGWTHCLPLALRAEGSWGNLFTPPLLAAAARSLD